MGEAGHGRLLSLWGASYIKMKMRGKRTRPNFCEGQICTEKPMSARQYRIVWSIGSICRAAT